MTRLSTINDYREGGLRMIDLDSQIKALRLGWMKRIFTPSNGTWKSYLPSILRRNGGFLLFNCNYNMVHVEITSNFIGNYYSGGPIFVKVSQRKRIGNLSFGIIRRY